MEQVKLNSFAEAPYNPRNMTEEGLERLCASIKSHTESLEGWRPEDGFRLIEPIILNKVNNRLVGGHMRCRALQKLGQDWVAQDDIRYVSITDERKEAALNIVLNNPKVKGEWDYPKLREVIAEIDHGDFNLE